MGVRHQTQALLRDVRSCRLCAEHLPAGPHPVLQMDSRASVLIASQAPGRRVHESGVPFDDASGKRLRAWMEIESAVFYDPTRVAILPMGFCYPGTGASGDLPPRPECAQAWREQLLGSMPSLQLTLVIGQYALDYHLANRHKASLTETVRAWRELWPNVLPLPHPSPRNNPWLKKNPWFENEVIPVLRNRLRSLLRG
jgi:uracil-DNA glycosylase